MPKIKHLYNHARLKYKTGFKTGETVILNISGSYNEKHLDQGTELVIKCFPRNLHKFGNIYNVFGYTKRKEAVNIDITNIIKKKICRFKNKFLYLL